MDSTPPARAEVEKRERKRQAECNEHGRYGKGGLERGGLDQHAPLAMENVIMLYIEYLGTFLYACICVYMRLYVCIRVYMRVYAYICV